MIQVMSKTFKIMELLADAEELGLGELAQMTGMNKGTLCNIVRAVAECGYIERRQHGRYAISPRLSSLLIPGRLAEDFYPVIRQKVFALAEQLRESVVVSALSGSRIKIIVQAQPERELMVNQAIVFKNLSLYTSVSGRGLLAFAPPAKQRFCFDVYGPPGEQWNNARTLEEFQNACAEIRKNDIFIMDNFNMEIKSFAVPILGTGHYAVAALGLTMPISRATSGNVEKIETALSATAKELTDTIYAN